jgi:hypothetical protein
VCKLWNESKPQERWPRNPKSCPWAQARISCQVLRFGNCPANRGVFVLVGRHFSSSRGSSDRVSTGFAIFRTHSPLLPQSDQVARIGLRDRYRRGRQIYPDLTIWHEKATARSCLFRIGNRRRQGYCSIFERGIKSDWKGRGSVCFCCDGITHELLLPF